MTATEIPSNVILVAFRRLHSSERVRLPGGSGQMGALNLSHGRMSASRRRALFALLVVYGIATTLVPFADSLLETAAHEGVEHFEPVSPPCNVGHDQISCPLCRFVSLASKAAPPCCELDLQDSHPCFTAAALALPRDTRWFSPLGPRGPPPA